MQRRNLFKALLGLPVATTLAGRAPQTTAQAGASAQSMQDMCTRLHEELHHRYNGDMAGLATGFIRLDRMTHGLRKGELTVIAARPSMGKSNLAQSIGMNVALHPTAPQPVAFFTLEDSAEKLSTKMLASLSETSIGHLRNGRIARTQWPAIETGLSTLAGAPLFIDDTPALTTAELGHKTRELKQQQPDLSLIIVDSLQFIEASLPDNPANRCADAAHALKSLAQELQVPVIVISQLNRAVEERADKRPVIADLRSFNPVARLADLVLLLYRDEVYHEYSHRIGEADILIARNTHGDTGAVVLSFEGQYARFRDFVPEFATPDFARTA